VVASRSPSAHPQWWQHQQRFTMFTDKHFALRFLRLARHRGQVVNTSGPAAAAGSSMPAAP
jgi:hypothetical protein